MSKDELINKYLQIEEKIEALEKDFPDSLQKQTILQKQSPQTKTKTKIRMRTPILKRPWQALSFNFRKKSKDWSLKMTNLNQDPFRYFKTLLMYYTANVYTSLHDI